VIETGRRATSSSENDLESWSRLSSNEFKLVAKKTCAYGWPRVKLKIMCVTRF